MAQDARFLGGSVGANHGAALERLFVRALDERPDAVVLLVDSGGVRLHEANAAELALARALRALFDARRAGIPTLAIVAGAAFGGASVLAAACERLRLLPGTRFGLSGPGVIETARGKAELDAHDPEAVAALFGARARAASGIGELLADDIDALRDAIRAAAAASATVRRRRAGRVGRKARGAASTLLASRRRPRRTRVPRSRFFDGANAVDPTRWIGASATATCMCCARWRRWPSTRRWRWPLRDALRDHLPRAAPLVIVEDSAGHATTRAAEALGVSEYLAAHAARLALLRSDGHAVLGLVAGCGHSAAFFVNALQAATLDALAGARVEAMATDAIARVTRLPARELAALIEDDAMLGQPVRHLAALGGVARTHAGPDARRTARANRGVALAGARPRCDQHPRDLLGAIREQRRRIRDAFVERRRAVGQAEAAGEAACPVRVAHRDRSRRKPA